MLIFFSGSSVDLDEHLPYLETIRDAVYGLDAELSDEWLGPVIATYKKGKERGYDVDWQQAHTHNMDQMSKSDAAIIEATSLNLPFGFYIAKALELKKPTLVIERQDLRTQLLSGIKDELLTVHQYSSHDELRTIVTDFVKQYTIKSEDLQISVKVSRDTYRFLDTLSDKTAKDKPELINEILENASQKGSYEC